MCPVTRAILISHWSVEHKEQRWAGPVVHLEFLSEGERASVLLERVWTGTLKNICPVF